MAQVYGIHEIELRPGADPAALEALAAGLAALAGFAGWRLKLLKGERGVRKDKYLVLTEIDSLAARYMPDSGPSEEAQAMSDDRAAAFWARWVQLATAPGDDDDDDVVVTDYVVVE